MGECAGRLDSHAVRRGEPVFYLVLWRFCSTLACMSAVSLVAKAVPLGGLGRGRPEQNASSVRLVLEGASSSVILPSHAESLHHSIDPYSYNNEQEKLSRH